MVNFGLWQLYDESESLTSTQKVLALVLVFVGKRLLNFPGAKLSS